MTAGAARSCAGALTPLVAAAQRNPPREPTSCGTNIVSATVAASYCSHRAGSDDVIDLIILWRGRAGWSQRRFTAPFGVGGSRTLGSGRAGDDALFQFGWRTSTPCSWMTSIEGIAVTSFKPSASRRAWRSAAIPT
jgi:hypothetical protein